MYSAFLPVSKRLSDENILNRPTELSIHIVACVAGGISRASVRVSAFLRLHNTFEGVLRKKIRTLVVLK